MAARYWIRIPNAKNRHHNFRVFKDGKIFRDVRIDAVNTSLSNKEIDYSEALRSVQAITSELRRLEQPSTPIFPDKNLDVLRKAITEYDERKIMNRSRKMGIAGLKRCINLLGSSDLHTIPLDVLEKLVEKQRPESQPKIAIYTNVLLRLANRTERLMVPAQPDPDVKYLTVEEFQVVLGHLKPEYKYPVMVAFSTGCRLGEVFALSRFGRRASVWVERQMYADPDNGRWYGPCKWRKKRWAPVIGIGREIVMKWITFLAALPEADKQKLRRLSWNEIVREACEKAFPSLPHKHLNFRDVRHCYAIHWLDRGATLRHVSQSMGNTERVVSKHYSGFVQTDEAEVSMLALDG